MTSQRPFRALVAVLLVATLAALAAAPATAGYVPGSIDLGFTRVASSLSRPVFLTHAGDGSHRKFVVEQDGRIFVYTDRWTSRTTFLDIRDRVYSGGNEQGLLGLAFHPDYETNRRFYVNYTDGNGDTVIAEYRATTATSNVADRDDRILFKLDQPASNHNGGWLGFGPYDKYLYIAMGDGGGSGDPWENAQDINDPLGKILRINPLPTRTRPYVIPSDNPYVGRTGNDLVWSIGLRNPWRDSFDRATGDLWIGDVGQNAWEEVDWAKASDTTRRNAGRGYNFGWDCYEGRHTYEGGCGGRTVRWPVAEYSRSSGNCAVTGGYVYRGTDPALADMRGTYIFGDYCSGRVWALASSGDGNQNEALLRDTGYMISSFGEDERGYLYVVHHGGSIYRLTDRS